MGETQMAVTAMPSPGDNLVFSSKSLKTAAAAAFFSKNEEYGTSTRARGWP
jgi:hypothetical protein